MRTLLVNPPNIPAQLDSGSCLTGMFCNFLDGRITRMFSIENLGLGYLASYLRSRGHDARVLDACLLEISLDETVRRMVAEDYGLVGFTGPQAAFGEVRFLARRLREAGYRGVIVYGGGFATLNAKRILSDIPEIDIIVRGDGEVPLEAIAQRLSEGVELDTVPNAVGRLEGRFFEGPTVPLSIDRDATPWPARDFVEVALSKSRTLGVSSSAGCGFGRCSFCSPGRVSQEHVARWRPRDAAAVVDEVVTLCREHQPRWLSFVDPDFLGHCRLGIERAKRILRSIRDRGVSSGVIFSCRSDEIEAQDFGEFADLGVEQVFVGFESFVPHRLQMFNKGLDVDANLRALRILEEHGVYVVPGHILFDPYVSIDDVVHEVRAYEAMDFYSLSKLTKSLYVLPETPIWRRMINDKVVCGNYSSYSYSVLDPRAERLRQALLGVQQGVYPQFHEIYLVHRPFLENSQYAKLVKAIHLEVFGNLLSCVRGDAPDSALAEVVSEGTRTLGARLWDVFRAPQRIGQPEVGT